MATAKKSAAKKAAAKKVAAKRMGRPPKPEGEKRTATLTIRLHTAERAEIESAAEHFDLTVTDLVLTSIREKVAGRHGLD